VLRRDLRASDTYAVTISHDAVAHSLIENAAGATVEIVEGHTLTLGGNLTDSAGTQHHQARNLSRPSVGSRRLINLHWRFVRKTSHDRCLWEGLIVVLMEAGNFHKDRALAV